MTVSSLLRSREQMWSDLLVALGGSESYKTMSEEQMLAAIRNTYGGSVSALTTSESDLLASIISAAGGSASDLTQDEERMLATLLAALGGGGSALSSSTDALLAASVNAAAGGGGGGYVASAVHFASGTFLNTDSLVAGADSPYLSASFWYRSTYDAQYQTIFQNAGAVSSYSCLIKPAIPDNEPPIPTAFFVDMVDATDTNTMANSPPPGTGGIALTDGNWHSVIISGQSNLSSGQKILKVYIDGIDIGDSGYADDHPSFVMTNNGVQFSIGDDTFGDYFIGDICDLRIDDKTWLTDGDIAEATRRLLVTADNKPVDPATATASLGAPLMLFSGDASTFGTNQGTGGAFVLTGSLTDATTSPSSDASGAPDWLPSGAVVYSDFVNGRYYAGGAATTLDDVWTENTAWSVFDPSLVVDGVGLVSRLDDCAPTLSRTYSAPILAETDFYVRLTGVLGSSSSMEIAASELPDYTYHREVDPKLFGQYTVQDANGTHDTSSSHTVLNYISTVVAYTANTVRVSMNGDDPTTHSVGATGDGLTDIEFGLLGAFGSGSKITEITIWTGVPSDATMKALSHPISSAPHDLTINDVGNLGPFGPGTVSAGGLTFTIADTFSVVDDEGDAVTWSLSDDGGGAWGITDGVLSNLVDLDPGDHALTLRATTVDGYTEATFTFSVDA